MMDNFQEKSFCQKITGKREIVDYSYIYGNEYENDACECVIIILRRRQFPS